MRHMSGMGHRGFDVVGWTHGMHRLSLAEASGPARDTKEEKIVGCCSPAVRHHAGTAPFHMEVWDEATRVS
jgi:hypothetical protein